MALGLKDWTEPLTKQERAQMKAELAYERKLESALLKLANECDALQAFEAEVRSVIGHTNWSVLRLRVDEARAALMEK